MWRVSPERVNVVEAEAVPVVEGSMCAVAMRDGDAPPGSWTASRTKGQRPASSGCSNASPFRRHPSRTPARRMPDASFNLGRSRVRESRSLGSVGAKAEWLSYPTIPTDRWSSGR